MTIRQLGAELLHENGRTDMTKLTGTFRNFANWNLSSYRAVNTHCLGYKNQSLNAV